MRTKFKGANGVIWFDDSNVYIQRSSWVDTLLHDKGVISIPLSAIEDIEYKEGGLTNGYISIVKIGYSSPHWIGSALKDDFTIIFRVYKNRSAEQFADDLRSVI